MHSLSTSFVLGFHGCDRNVAEALLAGNDFESSKNDYDWLGHGVYFWEANPKRGLDFAHQMMELGKPIDKPAVVGAVIDLGFCLDLTTTAGTQMLQITYEALANAAETSGNRLPRNSKDHDMLRRNLDCAVINSLHEMRKQTGERRFDTVKGVFVEGNRIYDGAGLFEKTHIQICVRSQDMIKGVFRVPDRLLSTM